MQVNCNSMITKEQPFFSVIMPVYNAEDVVENTLKCINNQAFKNYEVIIVNDGSTDNTEKRVLDYINDKPDFHYYSQVNGGPGSSRWLACKKANGRYFAFIDDDDYWYPEKLKIIYDEISDEYQVYYHDEIEVLGKKRREMITRQLEDDALSDLIINGNALYTSATVVEGEFFEKIDPYYDKKRAGEDYECWIRLAVGGAKFKYVNRILGEYRRTNDSLTMSNKDCVLGILQFLVDKYDYLDREKYSDTVINEYKTKSIAYNHYKLGRWLMKRKDFSEAKVCLKKAHEDGYRSLKRFIAGILAFFHIAI